MMMMMMIRYTLTRKRAPPRFSATLQQPWRRFALSGWNQQCNFVMIRQFQRKRDDLSFYDICQHSVSSELDDIP